ncbi:uncharacterized protein K452DRAFT_209900, partial [Aplosporella prunicola CBS 121167]
GQSALQVACCGGLVDVAKALIEHGADLCQADDQGWFPAITASSYGRMDTVVLLIRAGVDVNATYGEDGSTALHKAVEHFHGLSTVKILLEHGADASKQDNEGKTPLDI